MPLLKLLTFGFIAGCVATLIFHQGLWWVFNQIGVIPPDRPAWPLDPIPPYGVPSVISKAFWGGLWGAGLALLLGQLSGAGYWAASGCLGIAGASPSRPFCRSTQAMLVSSIRWVSRACTSCGISCFSWSSSQ